MLDSKGNGKIVSFIMTMLGLSSFEVSWEKTLSVSLKFHIVRKQINQMLVWDLESIYGI